jgi:hypothetical protein
MKKFLKIVLFSAIETAVFGLLWDFFFDKGQIVLGSLLAFLPIAIEHIIARNTADGLGIFANFRKRFGLQAILGATELVFWDVWRLIHEGIKKVPGLGPVVAMVVFGLLMTVQHNAEHNVSNNNGFFKKLFRSQGLTISFIEAVTAMAWLLADDIGTGHRLLSLIPLGIGLTVEHVVREFGEPVGANF